MNINSKQEYIKSKIDKYYKNKSKNKKIVESKKIKTINFIKGGIINRIYWNMESRFNIILKTKKLNTIIRFNKVLGCSLEELEIHLKNQFKFGMTFNNYGTWEVDHIIPISKFDLTNKENIFLCFNYKNLQPLWKEENRRKFNKILDTISNNSSVIDHLTITDICNTD